MRLTFLIFFTILVLFSLPNIFSPLRNWDEAWYAEIIKNMASGNYNLLVPFWNGEYYFDKPPLYFWLSFPIVKLFGIGEWQVRFISVVAAAFSVVLIYLIGRKLFNKVSGIFASIIFVSLGQVYVRFSHGNLDALLTAFFLATFYFWLKKDENKRWVILSGLFLGLGLLIKGWTLGLFPLYLVFLYSFFKESRLFPQGLYVLIGFAILSSGWWYVLGIREYGNQFSDWYLKTAAEGTLNSPFVNFSLKPVEYFIRDLGIWLFFIPAVFFSLKKKIGTNFSIIITLLLVSTSFLLALSFAHEKLDWHNLPIYPLIALVLGFTMSNIYKKDRKKIIFAFCFLLFVQFILAYKIENIYPDRSKIGADLGYMITQVAKEGDVVILDDHDFTSFLYYSKLKRVYVVSNESIDKREFWRIKYEDLDKFIKENKSVVLITRNLKNISTVDGDFVASGYGYEFIRFSQ